MKHQVDKWLMVIYKALAIVPADLGCFENQPLSVNKMENHVGN